ncbi:hypothetical protein J6590_046760 [Homalodisca vitripennis]|nr:hypothetical protein J6590_046760 [Homalodisca vitripennis]
MYVHRRPKTMNRAICPSGHQRTWNPVNAVESARRVSYPSESNQVNENMQEKTGVEMERWAEVRSTLREQRVYRNKSLFMMSPAGRATTTYPRLSRAPRMLSAHNTAPICAVRVRNIPQTTINRNTSY